jgi:hypothetical protein
MVPLQTGNLGCDGDQMAPRPSRAAARDWRGLHFMGFDEAVSPNGRHDP